MGTTLSVIGILLLAGAAGGLVQALSTMGGIVLPQPVRRKYELPNSGGMIEVSMWMPGVIGNIVISAIVGLMVFAYDKDSLLLIGKNESALTLGWRELALVIIAGIASSMIVTQILEAKNWKKASAILAARDPNKAQVQDSGFATVMANTEPA